MIHTMNDEVEFEMLGEDPNQTETSDDWDNAGDIILF